jgi:N-methylhydantoinase B/oxoprolinase/acetone carboxylase alpha subunit
VTSEIVFRLAFPYSIQLFGQIVEALMRHEHKCEAREHQQDQQGQHVDADRFKFRPFGLAGGGGFGEARLRARELVERDVRLGYVSAAAAKLSYGDG